MLRSVAKRWNRFWFEAVTPDNLGLCRIVLYGTMFLYYVLTPWLFPSWGYHEDFVPWGSVSRVFWSPVWLMSVLHLPPASTQVLQAMQIVWRAALAFSCIGLFTRASTVASFVIGFYLFGVPVSFGRIHHQEHVLIFSFLIMACSRCGDAWSVDALIRKAKAGTAPTPTVLSGEYAWPVRMIWVVIALTYFAAGVSKVRHSGFEWVASGNMSYFLMSQYYHVSDADPLTSWGQVLSRGSVLPHLLAASGVILELSLVIALFSPRSRWFLVPGVAGMQFGIAVLMGPNFYQMIICQLLWVPWDWVAARLTGSGTRGYLYTVLYDGACGLCGRTVGVLRALDLSGRVEFLDAVSDWPSIAKRFPDLDRTQCFTDMHVVTPQGEKYAGFYGYRALAHVLPLGWLFLPILYLPGIPGIGSRVYSSVAARRHQGTCALPDFSQIPKEPVARNPQ
jgi:predicted DCC family thiol-disulfide oxidoreductase YuxK